MTRHSSEETANMLRTPRRIGVVVLVLLGVAIALVPALARAGSPAGHDHRACVHALELADVGMRQLGAMAPVDRGASVAFATGQRHRGWRLTHEYVAAVHRYAATMAAYHDASTDCRA